MKNFALNVLFVAILSYILLTGSANALTFNTTLTADNHYALYFGDETGVTFVGRNESGPCSSSGTFNWSEPESFLFDMDSGDYIYLVAWSDDCDVQGWIGQFLFGSSTLLSNISDWEVYLTNSDLGDYFHASMTGTWMQMYINAANAAGWNPVTNYVAHGSGPWGNINGISPDAQWIWGSALLSGSGLGKCQIFRTKVASVPEPATILLVGSGLFGLAGLSRKFKKG